MAHTTPTVELAVDGQVYGGWLGVDVVRSLTRVPSSFRLQVTERWAGRAEPWPILPGARCALSADGAPLVEGWVDAYAPVIAADEHTVRITGRSLVADLVDCSAVVPGGQFRGYDLAQIARALAEPFGVEVVVAADVGAPFPEAQIQQGETVYELVERLSRLRGVVVADDPRGRLVLTRAREGGAAVTLALGTSGAADAGTGPVVPVLYGSARLNHAARYSEIRVKAQRAGSDSVSGDAAAAVAGRATDPDIARYRPLIVVAGSQADPATATERAAWEVVRRAGEGTRAELTVQGWRRPGGALWEPNTLVHVRAPMLGVARSLLIGQVALSLGSLGALARLTVMPPGAFTPVPAEPEAEASSGGGGNGALWADVVPA